MATTTELQAQIDELNCKLDFIIEELGHQKRHRLEMEDLKNDLTLVAKDLYRTTVEELEEVSEHVKPGDLVYLFKKLLRNANNLARLFDQLESLRDLMEDLKPISKDVYATALVKLDELDRQGYFEFAGHMKGMADDAVATLIDEDLEQLRENVPRLIRWAKSVTQPGTLQALETLVVALARGEASPRQEMSLFELLREMNTPEVRRGLVALLEFIKGLGAAHGAPGPVANKDSTTIQKKEN